MFETGEEKEISVPFAWSLVFVDNGRLGPDAECLFFENQQKNIRTHTYYTHTVSLALSLSLAPLHELKRIQRKDCSIFFSQLRM